jgi:UDPglucose 6-dehydrogenase
MIYFYGTSHAAEHLRSAAEQKGVKVVDAPEAAEVLFVSEDTPTAADGERDLRPVIAYLVEARQQGKPIVLTSQVPPGFTRSLGYPHIYHQAETLRILDAMDRALHPEQLIVGAQTYQSYELLPFAYRQYLGAFHCPVHIMTYEDAEFSKIAINMFLAAQVEATNRLAEAAKRVDANWWAVKEVLQRDKRIGQHAYLTPGRWQDSLHLLRDHYTLERILAR